MSAKDFPPCTQIRVQSEAALSTVMECFAPQREHVTIPSYVCCTGAVAETCAAADSSATVPAAAPKVAIRSASPRAITAPTAIISIQNRVVFMTCTCFRLQSPSQQRHWDAETADSGDVATEVPAGALAKFRPKLMSRRVFRVLLVGADLFCIRKWWEEIAGLQSSHKVFPVDGFPSEMCEKLHADLNSHLPRSYTCSPL